MDYSLREIMTISAAKEINDGDIVFCGTGISMLAAMTAKHLNAPDSVIFFETGAIDSQLKELPMAVGDPRVMSGSIINACMADVFGAMQNRFFGSKMVGVLGAAQVDCYGNLNSTVIGDYLNPKVRFSGSGGACDVASFVNKAIIFIQHEKRKFVSRLDYFTSPGWLNGYNSRREAGLSEGGPEAVITNLGVMGFDEETRHMYVRGCYPGIDPKDIAVNTGFEIDISRAVEIEAPTSEELKILRERCDPQGLIL